MWPPKDIVLVMLSCTLCVMLIGAMFLPVLTGTPHSEPVIDSIGRLVFLIAGFVGGWLAK